MLLKFAYTCKGTRCLGGGVEMGGVKNYVEIFKNINSVKRLLFFQAFTARVFDVKNTDI